MSVNAEIAEALRAICKRNGEGTEAFTAEVTAVDIATRTCTVLGISDKAGVSYEGVLLMAVIDDGLLYKPKVGSIVLVGNNTQQQPFIMMFSQLDEIFYVVGNSVMDFKPELIEFNGGQNFGLVSVVPLVQKINALENLLNQFITLFNTHVHTGGTISGSTGTTTTPETGTISPITQQSDIEDTKITH